MSWLVSAFMLYKKKKKKGKRLEKRSTGLVKSTAKGHLQEQNALSTCFFHYSSGESTYKCTKPAITPFSTDGEKDMKETRQHKPHRTAL